MKKYLLLFLMLFLVVSLYANINSKSVYINAVSFEGNRLVITTTDGQFKYYHENNTTRMWNLKGFQAQAMYAMAMGFSASIYFFEVGSERKIEAINVIKD